MVHKTLEEHVEFHCSNPNCHKKRTKEKLASHFEGSHHYVSWICSECKHNTWWKTKYMASGIHHKLL